MEEFNKFQKLKLKPIKLKELLFESKLKLEVNNIKTESQNIKSRNKQDNLYYNNPFLNTLNSTSLSKMNRLLSVDASSI